MADNGHIFYSSVDDNLRAELNERAAAGRTNRSTKHINYMVGKIANVELIAYRNQEHSIEQPTNYLGKLGGDTSRNLDYIPQGYLNPNRDYKTTGNGQSSDNAGTNSKYNSYRVGPYIRTVNVSTSDGQQGIMQTATVELVIPDPVRDLDYVESVFMRPGRAATLKIQHPESAVITGKKLTDAIIQPAVESSKITKNLDMNTAIYNMLIISFTMSYQNNGTINVTLHLRGVSSVYTDITCIINSKENNSANKEDVKLLDTLYRRIYNEIDDLHKEYVAQKKDPSAVVNVRRAFDVNASDQVLLGSDNDCWWWHTNDTTSKTKQVYITLGYLISFINKNIIKERNKIVTNGLIICNSNSVYCNIVENIVSIDPWRIVLSPLDSYGELSANKPRYLIDTTNTSTDQIPFRRNDGTGNPSLIYINLNVIEQIEKSYQSEPSKFTVTNLLRGISNVINECTGGMIKMELIMHPIYNDFLFYYDTNYLAQSKKQEVLPYSIPLGVKNNTSGSIVKDFKVDVKLPTSMQNLMYTINSGDSISEAEIAPHVNYMYNNSIVERTISSDSGSITDSFTNDNASTIDELDKQYTESYKKYNDELLDAISKYGTQPTNSDFRLKLLAATKKKMQYPTNSIKNSIQLTSPVYPHEVEFTIDGIHGFRYGDVLEFNILPNRYKKFATFSIISVVHNVSSNGAWTSTIRCIMRPYITDN